MNEQSTYLTKADLASMFRRCERGIDAMVKRRELPTPMRLGGRVVWSRSELELWLHEKAKAGTKDVIPVARCEGRVQ